MSTTHEMAPPAASAPRTRRRADVPLGPGYKWIALSNTTLGVLMVTINMSIVLIALPNIFDGIGLNPLQSGNTGYLLWTMMGFMVATAVLVVAFGRLGDMYGRVRMYNLGFAVFSVFSILLSVTWMHGSAAAIWIIAIRILQGIGGALLMANSTAILTDAFPANQRGTALGINAIAAIAGSFIGLILGGILGPTNWHLVFLVSVPFGVFGTAWAFLKLRDTGVRKRAKMDWWGNITFAVGLIVLLVGITYGIQPYGTHTMGWTSPTVLAEIIGGLVLLAIFVVIETKVADPLFHLSLFQVRAFAAGNLASLLTGLGRGGLQFMLIIWLQGIWLPQHGYSFEDTPLWAGIYMIPLTIGFLASAPAAGFLCDRVGPKVFTVGGALITAASFGLMLALPVNFPYWAFALILVVNGIGSGMFISPNRVEMMNSLPADQRGVGSGMIATFQNSAMVLSIGIFFSLMVAGLSKDLPSALQSGLTAQGVPASSAAGIAHLPPIAVLFAAFLGYNPMQQLLGPVLHTLPANNAAYLTGRSFFPHLITHPFQSGLSLAFGFAIAACVVAAIAAAFSGRYVVPGAGEVRETVGEELASAAGEILPDPLIPDLPTGAVTGAVRDETGAPLAGVAITAADPDGRQLARARTDAGGRYRLAGLPRGSHVIIASVPHRHPEVGTAVVGSGPSLCDFTLAEADSGAVGGQVRSPHGRGLGAVTVVVTDIDGQVAGHAVTSPDGEYHVAGLPDGDYTLTATGHAPATAPVRVDAGRSVSVRLEMGQELP